MIMIELNVKNWSQVIDNNELVLVDVYGPACGPCITMESRLKELERTQGAKVVFTKIEAVSNMECLDEFRLTSIPTLLYIRAGKLVKKEVGLKSVDQIKQAIDKYLS
jgi:thioredoxin 1